jgi:Ca-activated chloride channel family protein
VGGAKDVGSFRNNINQGYLPQADAITVEGLYYEYYFDTGNQHEDVPPEVLFYPSYSVASCIGISGDCVQNI